MPTSRVENQNLANGDNLEFFVNPNSTRTESVGVLHPVSWESLIPRWHFAMLNDVERNKAFETAIKHVIHPNSTVLDVGAGSGLLAMMAARQGASFVTSCEMIQPIAQMAKKIIAINGFQDQIKIVPKKSDDLIVGLDLAKRADVLITETVDCGLVGEGILPIIRHARQALLTPDAAIIPAKAVVKFSLLESDLVHNLNFASNAANFDVSSFNTFSTAGYFPVRLWIWPHRLLSKPTTAFEFDFRVDPLKPRQKEISVKVEHNGTLHGVVFWFDLDLGNGVVLSNAVDNEKSHWMQAVQCFEKPMFVKQGDLLKLMVQQSDTNIDFQITKA
ncbi:50S ribosomal protein L11 methyltransferase [Nostoc sp. CENA67]|uniref:50S ribosomal protein L11 methyltransferase n=1 Tax=Amazonocrinis nigriterrae CENA67 TaxID=2794033 RepID=A0A8J7HKE3_9NOST|nr:50S ribosomal protein L11 methyltransferase [Amazonocrinis nigriterrae]MBH8560712.1 50S ribosomal protein L11 methyltransferase [Amazonocrinis nigriterrae CENA67]